MDIEADAIIRALFVRNQDLAYRMTITAMRQAAKLAAPGQQKPAGWLSGLFDKRESTAQELRPSIRAIRRQPLPG